MEHTLHLAAKHFVEDVAPTSAGKLLTKMKEAMANATEGDDGVDLDSLNIEPNGIKAEMSRDKDDVDDEDVEFDVANLLLSSCRSDSNLVLTFFDVFIFVTSRYVHHPKPGHFSLSAARR